MKNRFLYELDNINVEEITLANELHTKQFLRSPCAYYYPVKFFKNAIMLAQVFSEQSIDRIRIMCSDGSVLFLEYKKLNITNRKYIRKTEIDVECSEDLIERIVSSNKRYQRIAHIPVKTKKKRRSTDKNIYHTEKLYVHVYNGGGCSPR